MFFPDHFVVIFCIAIAAFLSFQLKKLTLIASLIGGLMALVIYFATGFSGLYMLAAFFVFSVLATLWKKSEKIDIGNDSQTVRNTLQVLANGGVVGILSVLILVFPELKSFFYMMLASALASATADTLSSELGTVYGNHFFNILTFKKERRGLDGVISIEGTLIGICGAGLIAGVDAYFHGWSLASAIVICSGMIGNFADSILGAAFERRGKLSNNEVNFLNTLIAACSSLFIFYYVVT